MISTRRESPDSASRRVFTQTEKSSRRQVEVPARSRGGRSVIGRFLAMSAGPRGSSRSSPVPPCPRSGFRAGPRCMQGVREQCLRTALLLLLMVLSGTRDTWELDRTKQIDQYAHDVWTSQNGLPGEAVYQILQTRDGYLWLRTSAGLVRFDGVRFVLVAPVVGDRPINEPVKAICKSAEGDLLVRSTSRTLVYKNGAFFDYRPPQAAAGRGYPSPL